MATWTDFRYGGQPWRQAQYWVPSDDINPAVNPRRPCIIYAPGHGWGGRHPNYFYGPPTGPAAAEPLFTNRIEPAEVSDPVVAISIWQASKSYGLFDNFSHAAWVVTTAYALDDIVENGGDYWRCIKAHTSASADEPGVGANWEFKWVEVDTNDITNALWTDRPPMSPAYLSQGIRDVQACVQYVKSHADFFGIDATKIVLMGSSAGGQAVGAAAYARSLPWTDDAGYPATVHFGSRFSSRPQAVVLDISPNDFKWYAWDGIMGNLWGRDFTATTWDRYPNALKSAMSGLGVLRDTRLHLPTYLAYAGSRFDHTGGTDDPPYSDSPFHHAKNGWEYLKELEAQGQANVVFLEDASGAGFFERWTSTTASTQIPDTDRDLDIWNWLSALWGL